MENKVPNKKLPTNATRQVQNKSIQELAKAEETPNEKNRKKKN